MENILCNELILSCFYLFTLTNYYATIKNFSKTLNYQFHILGNPHERPKSGRLEKACSQT